MSFLKTDSRNKNIFFHNNNYRSYAINIVLSAYSHKFQELEACGRSPMF